MGNVKRHFIKGRMNKSVDERLVPNGEYINALNVRLGSTEGSEVGSVENSKGNTKLTTLQYKGVDLSEVAQCIGSFEDGVKETIYWFIHDGSNSVSSTGKVDMIVSYETNSDLLTYHVVSASVLNFNPTYLITGVNKVEDLLFFTDDYNPPRKINVKRSYPAPTSADNDQIVEDDISVIKKPPKKAPTLNLIDIPGEENYLETNFVSFAYRYKYIDNEYSALSQFTDVAFESSPFNLDPDTNFNDGMLNRYNTAVVGFNTGDSNVIGIDVCFKLGNDFDVRVAKKYIKSEQGWPNEIVQTLNFTNQEIYTLLPSSEILRLYDNVPLIAQAQTVMGNRLMYGNYEDGYDLTSSSGALIKTNYTAEVISEIINITQDQGEQATGVNYTIDTNSTVTANQAKVVFDFTDSTYDLVQGGVFGFSFTVSHKGFSGSGWGTSSSNPQHPSFSLSFTFNLAQDYNSIFEMVNSPEFQNQIGVTNFQSVSNCSSGSTFTDTYNCAISAPGGYTLASTGITSGNQGFLIGSSATAPNVFSLQLMAAQYTNTSTASNQNFEYFKISNSVYSFQTESSNKSLHSNRDYEIGIVYMDEYKRATTALTSTQNTVFVPPTASSYINKIRATLPVGMTAPSWAQTYKFVLKQSRANYDVIYSNTYYYDNTTSSYWFRLVGQDQALVQAGTELIVKRDSLGTLSEERKVTVLDKVSQPTNFLSPNSEPVVNVPGLYMRLRVQGFSVSLSSQNICYPSVVSVADNFSDFLNPIETENKFDGYSIVNYPLFTGSSTFSFIDVPTASVVRIKIKFRRDDSGLCGGANGAELCVVNETFTASQPYQNFYTFWEGENVGPVLTNAFNCQVACEDESGPNEIQIFPNYISVSESSSTPIYAPEDNVNKIGFYIINDGTERLYLQCVNGSRFVAGAFGIGSKDSRTTVEICIQEPGSLVAFETVPNEIADGVFFEGSENYDIVGGYHQGNVTNQDATTEGVVDLDFFNCYSFGNGIESYKIEDSSIGQSFALGERTILVSAQDFKRADRFADITYSGVYNDESNVNKLNEFNLGLLNFKTLEDVYGPVQKMVARETDILVLQEDRISYVLTNKDAITDAEGGNILTAAPLILGQQVARVEEYGISANPESYAEFGMDKYFTDAKRGAVIQLRGSSFSNEQLSVVSQEGMRSYFRDLFNANFNTQKLGGYDPYMDEYVVSSNENKLPVEAACVNCDISQTFNVFPNSLGETFCVNLGAAVGDVTLSWGTPILSPSASFDVVATYNGTSFSATQQNQSGTLIFNKSTINPNTVEITITANGGQVGNLQLGVSCPKENELKIVMVCLTLDWQNGNTIHNEFNFTEGSYNSPLYQSFVSFSSGDNPVVSEYQMLTGSQGVGVFPTNGSTVYVQSNKLSSDTFQYNPVNNANRLRYLRSSNLYENTASGISNLLSAGPTTLDVTPGTTGASLYSGSFTLPNNLDEYLYLIYDYREAQPAKLCFGSSAGQACCACSAPSSFYLNGDNLMSSTSVYTDEGLSLLAPDQFYQSTVNGNSVVREQSGGVLLPTVSCAACDRKCTDAKPLPIAGTTLSNQQIYEVSYDLATGTGVVAIRFTPGAPSGIFATYNNQTTSVSSATTITSGNNPPSSYFEGPYYGDDTICTPASGVFPIYKWDEVDENFEDSETTDSINIVSSDLASLTSGGAGKYVLYVSKPTAAPSTLDLRIISACPPASAAPNWSVDVDCPRILTGFSASVMVNESGNVCSEPINQTLYNLPVLSPNLFGIPEVRDWVFKDELGQSLADDGYYNIEDLGGSCLYIHVVGGVIVEKTS